MKHHSGTPSHAPNYGLKTHPDPRRLEALDRARRRSLRARSARCDLRLDGVLALGWLAPRAGGIRARLSAV